MQITLYRRSFAVADSPVSHSFVPDHAGQHHTFTAGGRVHEATRREVAVTVPDDATVNTLRHVLCWRDKAKAVRSTAQEVFDFAVADDRGFSVARG
jgi:hypothetical protein